MKNKVVKIEKELKAKMQPEVLAVISVPSDATEEEKEKIRESQEQEIRRSGYTGIIIELEDRRRPDEP